MPIGRFQARFGRHWHSIAWFCDDVRQEWDRLQSFGIRVLQPGGRHRPSARRRRHLHPPQGHGHPARVLPTPGRLRRPKGPGTVQGSALPARLDGALAVEPQPLGYRATRLRERRRPGSGPGDEALLRGRRGDTDLRGNFRAHGDAVRLCPPRHRNRARTGSPDPGRRAGGEGTGGVPRWHVPRHGLHGQGPRPGRRTLGRDRRRGTGATTTRRSSPIRSTPTEPPSASPPGGSRAIPGTESADHGARAPEGHGARAPEGHGAREPPRLRRKAPRSPVRHPCRRRRTWRRHRCHHRDAGGRK